ncbi:MAG: response regulator [Chitinispirillaceae bacterium]
MKRILLADDEESILLAFRKLLESPPEVSVDTADSSEKARMLLGNNTYQAAIVDLRLKGVASLDGLELVRIIRQNNPSAVIIVVTAYSDESLDRVIYDSGASCCFEKPVPPKKIRSLLRDQGIYLENRVF